MIVHIFCLHKEHIQLYNVYWSPQKYAGSFIDLEYIDRITVCVVDCVTNE
jgi:hypothetical protein